MKTNIQPSTDKYYNTDKNRISQEYVGRKPISDLGLKMFRRGNVIKAEVRRCSCKQVRLRDSKHSTAGG